MELEGVADVYMVNRTCLDCSNRYSYSSMTPAELRDCPYCVALEEIASKMRDGKALGLTGAEALELVDTAELDPAVIV